VVDVVVPILIAPVLPDAPPIVKVPVVCPFAKVTDPVVVALPNLQAELTFGLSK